MLTTHVFVPLVLQLIAACYAKEILIKGGTVVNADQKLQADVLINDGVIAKVGTDLKASYSATVIDATNKYVMPGGIDPHTHLEMPFMGDVTCDDFYTGQLAALAGGTTFHIDFALPVNHDLMAGYHAWQAKARSKAVMDYGFHMAVTSWSEQVAADMATLTTQHGINSFKFFMAYKGALMVDDTALLEGFEQCRRLGALPQVHAENGDAVADGQQQIFNAGITGPEGHALSRPAALEAEATHRAITLAGHANVPLYVVHVMSGGAADEVARAKAAGQRVIGETVSSAISLEESVLWDADWDVAARYVMSPPIRSAAHRDRVRSALAGGILGVLATDHAVFNSSQKAAGRNDFRVIPNGVNGIEERLHVAWEEMVNTGLMSVNDFVRVTSTAAAQIFNIYPQKGHIAAGSDADVIILDPHVEHVISATTHHSALDYNVYEGKKIRGKVVTTIAGGRLVWHDGVLDVEKGSGRYIPLPVNGPLFDGLDSLAVTDLKVYGGVPVKRTVAKWKTTNEGDQSATLLAHSEL